MPNVMLFGGRVVGRWLGPEGEAITNSVSILLLKDPKEPLVPSTMGGHSKKVLAMNKEEDSHQNMKILVTCLILELLSLQSYNK